MSQPPAHSSSSTDPAARVVSVVGRVDTRERGFVFLYDEKGTEYFAHRAGFVEERHFSRCAVGDVFNHQASWGVDGKGMRAFDIREASDAEKIAVAEREEHRGNR